MTKEGNSSAKSILITPLMRESGVNTLNQVNHTRMEWQSDPMRILLLVQLPFLFRPNSLLLGTSCCHLCAYQEQDAHLCIKWRDSILLLEEEETRYFLLPCVWLPCLCAHSKA